MLTYKYVPCYYGNRFGWFIFFDEVRTGLCFGSERDAANYCARWR